MELYVLSQGLTSGGGAKLAPHACVSPKLLRLLILLTKLTWMVGFVLVEMTLAVVIFNN